MPDISTVTIKKNGRETTYNVKDATARTGLKNKVSKELGKGLSTNDYTTAEKEKLAGIEAQANKTVVDSALSDSSTNPVQNKVIKGALDGKVNTETGKGLSTNDFTNAYKTKLNNIEEEANKTIVDSALSLTSENPVQNKVVAQEINDKADVIISSASGGIAHFEDGAEADAKSVIAHIEPVQDLHGYDSPWPAGGGKNLIDYLSCVGVGARDGTDSVYGDNVSVSGNILTITQTYGSNGGILKGIQHPSIAEGTSFTVSVEAKCTGTNIVVGYGIYGGGGTNNINSVTVIQETWTKITRTFTAQGGDIGIFLQPVNDNTSLDVRDVQLELGTTLTTFAPYSNICPITGHTGMDVVRTGKNLLKLSEWETESNSGIIIGTDNISIINKGYQEKLNRYNMLNRSACVFSFHVKTVALADSRSSFAVYADETAKLPGSGTTGVGNITLDSIGMEKDITITVPNGTEYISFGGWGYRGEVQISNLQLELGSTATDYEPYQGETYPITFPTEAGTVYGGYVDVTNGKLVVDRVFMLLNDIEKWKTASTSTIDFAYSTDATDRKKFNNSFDGLMCSYAAVDKNNPQNSARWSGTLSITFGFKGLGLTLDQIKSDAEQGKISIVYELATPIKYDITPQQIALLLGVNNVWNDANGDTDVEYKADTKLYIEQLTKPTEDDMTANTNIASGKFFMVGNRLFLSTSAIASGDTINPGTNCTELSLADALNNLN